MVKILNLYAGIGGNRKLWGGHEITAIENNPKIAKIYQDFFPQDKMIITDAHQYLLEHFEEFDFIWSSPPCPSHSRFRKYFSCNAGIKATKPLYPDMKLYEEILFFKHYFKGIWCVENVISYYNPLIAPQQIHRHYFWCNFHISKVRKFLNSTIRNEDIQAGNRKKHIKKLQENLSFDLSKYRNIDIKTILRNCILPELGLHILNESQRDIQGDLFK